MSLPMTRSQLPHDHIVMLSQGPAAVEFFDPELLAGARLEWHELSGNLWHLHEVGSNVCVLSLNLGWIGTDEVVWSGWSCG
jgi:hypothetical protein